MEKAVGGDAPVVATVNIKIVPLEELVKEDFVGCSHYADAQENTRPENRARGSGLVGCGGLVRHQILPPSITVRAQPFQNRSCRRRVL